MGLTTKLITVNDVSPDHAAYEIGKARIYGNISQTPMVIKPTRGCEPWLTVPEGFWALKTQCSEFKGLLSPGFHPCQYACMDEISHLVSQQYVTYNVPVKQCPTADNVMVEIDVSLVLFVRDDVDDIMKFVYKLGPEGLDVMLQAQQEEAIRGLTQKKKYSDIYDLMETEDFAVPFEDENDNDVEQDIAPEPVQGAQTGLLANAGSPGAVQMAVIRQPGQPQAAIIRQPPSVQVNTFTDVAKHMENAKKELNEKVNPLGIEIYSITITNVSLPPQFTYSMEEATTFESKNEKQRAGQVYKLRVIEDDEARQQAEQRLIEDLAEVKASNEQRVASEKKITNAYIAETNALISEINENTTSTVRAISTESELKVATLHKERDVMLATLNAQASAEQERILNEARAYVRTKVAEAGLQQAESKAEALQALSEAESEAQTALVSRRDFDEKTLKISALSQFSTNKNLVITGSNKDNVVAQMLGAKETSLSIGLTQ